VSLPLFFPLPGSKGRVRRDRHARKRKKKKSVRLSCLLLRPRSHSAQKRAPGARPEGKKKRKKKRRSRGWFGAVSTSRRGLVAERLVSAREKEKKKKKEKKEKGDGGCWTIASSPPMTLRSTFEDTALQIRGPQGKREKKRKKKGNAVTDAGCFIRALV